MEIVSTVCLNMLGGCEYCVSQRAWRLSIVCLNVHGDCEQCLLQRAGVNKEPYS